MKALINASTYDFTKFYENRYVIFDSDILETGDMRTFEGADEIIDCKGCIVMPGLVNCHTHIYSALSRGMRISFNPVNFKDILDQLWWKLDKQLNVSDIYYSSLVYGIESVKSGITSLIDHHASGLCISGSLGILKKALCDELGLRGIFCFETSDRFNLKECIAENMIFSENRTENSAGIFGMHASMSLSDDSLREISRCIGNIPVHIHVAESRDDVEDCFKNYGNTIVERLCNFGILNEGSILAHCVHITEIEAEIIKNQKCYVALNPTSNMNNAVGLADYELFRHRGIKCLIGNDGLGSNITRDYLNLVYSMKNRIGSPTGFGLEELLQIIRNGYEYVSNTLNIKLGRIQKGYKADLITVPYLPPTPMDENNIFSHIFFGIFDNFHPRDVWVSGKNIVRGYNSIFDEIEILRKASNEAADLWQRIYKNNRC